MKRNLALVSYSSSEEENNLEKVSKRAVPKKKKLPGLSPSLIVQTPKDDPALHQGRIRIIPHIDGQWASHVYVSIRVERRSAMYNLVLDALKTAKNLEPALHDFPRVDENKSEKYFNLHVSLSRPIFLRTHQRDDLKREVKSLAEKSNNFKISFTSFSIFNNDEETRTFLALDIGSGHRDLKLLSDGLLPFLANLRQKEYYADPRFHASIAWALLQGTTSYDHASMAENFSSPLLSGMLPTQVAPSVNVFRPILHLPASLTTILNEQYASPLSSQSCSAFDIHELCVKIGKDVFSWRLKG
ncbi:uncharacterized protein C8R40DRAFT_1035714 [Lentinula edodes]|uniref:uncharacterized protein n=1 Tax=Lentinula edodes TaxID=5353 RepID=UPI001E8DA819|nr:uncharacterized protein C8R40DRAFT_1035714 [Lentinula edodes]KAH7879903.1 hypothetical protein C8R40DRAFT_1035714 [Lentinula edodes]